MNHPGAANPRKHLPRLIAWEVTRCCVLACQHCRAAAQPTPYPDELTTEECRKLLDNIASFAKPIIILTGGEPMLRKDIYDIAAHAHRLNLPVVMAPCGMLIDDASAGRMVEAGIRRISISLDGATAESHDRFRGVPGAFDSSLRGIEAAKRAGMDFQINTTVTRHNRRELEDILRLAIRLGASVFNPFLLVPTGRGKELADQELSAQEYEQTLRWLADQQAAGRIGIRVTCAPHYQRILRQAHGPQPGPPPGGCLGGKAFAFISHRGIVQTCGFLDIECGDVRKENYDFRRIWETSEVFLRLRDVDSYRGRCGFCEFRKLCGGCRARAFATTGDFLDEEPFCSYQPRGDSQRGAGRERTVLDDLDGRILSAIQGDFPAAERPFDVLAGRLGVEAREIMDRVSRLHADGIIRRLGAVFDSRSLGYASTLVAARIPPGRLDEVSQTVSELPGVTHNYSREHDYNLWFTLTAESPERIDAILEDLRSRTGIADFHNMPALKVYKIRVHFGPEDPSTPASAPASSAPAPPWSEDDKKLARLLQEDLPLVPRPFDRLAEQLNIPPARVIEKVTEWRSRGVIRRLGAVVRHQRLGYTANGMAVFLAPEDRVDDWGRCLAELPEVSHCYRRRPLPDFRYNLYAMTHGHSADEVRAIVARAAADLGATDYAILFSTKEYKKVSMRYFRD